MDRSKKGRYPSSTIIDTGPVERGLALSGDHFGIVFRDMLVDLVSSFMG
jgi:hypothetical protein